MAYIPNNNNYKSIIYSGESEHKIKILFDDVELEDADRYCEKLTLKRNILPDDGSKRFSLDNFVSQEAELILHDINETITPIIKGQVEISIGTKVGSTSLGDTYEYVPLGIFNIQDTPKTDKNKITLTLRDNAVLFDFYYDAKSLEEQGNSAMTKFNILQDICSKANVRCSVQSFNGMNDVVSTYDNTITARTYVSYLAEQAGALATIDRNGELKFVYLNELVTQKIPLYVVEKYEKGESYEIDRVVYEDAIRKFETNSDENETTLYINSANPYISYQEQINSIFDIVGGFQIDSLSTGRILGDPTIDCYDIIEIYGYYDNDNHFVNDETTIVARTLANHTLVYNGSIINQYNTQIGIEERTENVTLKSEPTFQKYAKTLIDNIENKIELVVAEQNEQKNQIAETKIEVDGIQNLFQITGGSNMIKDSQLLINDENMWIKGNIAQNSFFPSSDTYPSSSEYPLEYYFNNPNYVGGYDASLIGKTSSVAKIGVSNGKITTSNINITELIIGEMYTLSFKISNDDGTNSRIKLTGNNNVVYDGVFEEELDMEDVSYSFVAQTSNYILSIQSSSVDDGFVYVYDLMLNKGDRKEWQPASGELVSTTVKLSQLGVQVYSTGSEIATLMTSEGFQIRRFQNNTLYEIVTEFTKNGFSSKKGIVEELQVKNYDFRTIDYQGYETLILYKKESEQ
ncbi:MAG: hypothetical protein IKU37_01315 [Candidatus Gastranaerophilales bacterium]|nr:hypothetical protein [Candidatus Gastranaerophilales bacterium]